MIHIGCDGSNKNGGLRVLEESFKLIPMMTIPPKTARTISALLASLPFVIILSASAQIQQAWVAKYNNGITNGNHQALKMVVDSSGNVYVLGVSQNANTNTGYVANKYAPNGNPLWTARYDSTNYPTASPTAFALDSSNAVAVTGNAVTVKYDSNGNQLWTVPYNAQALAVDAGRSVYITGVSNNFSTMKLSASGSNKWIVTITGPSYLSQAIAVDSLTNVYVAGMETFYLRPEGNLAYVGLLKYDLNGKQLWADNPGYGGLFGTVQVVGLLPNGSGGIWLEANFAVDAGVAQPYSTLNFNSDGSLGLSAGNPTDNVTSFSTAFALDTSGNALVTGRSGEVIDGIFMGSYGTYKIDTNGNYLWGRLYPPTITGVTVANALVVDSANNVYVTGALLARMREVTLQLSNMITTVINYGYNDMTDRDTGMTPATPSPWTIPATSMSPDTKPKPTVSLPWAFDQVFAGDATKGVKRECYLPDIWFPRPDF